MNEWSYENKPLSAFEDGQVKVKILLFGFIFLLTPAFTVLQPGLSRDQAVASDFKMSPATDSTNPNSEIQPNIDNQSPSS